MKRAAGVVDDRLLASDLQHLLDDVKGGRVRYCRLCSRWFGLPWPLEHIPEPGDWCRMCGGTGSAVLAIPVWELQARLLAGRVHYLDNSMAFVITEMP